MNYVEIDIDQDSLRIGTAKAVARLMSFAQITCLTKHIVTILHGISSNGSSLRYATVSSRRAVCRQPATASAVVAVGYVNRQLLQLFRGKVDDNGKLQVNIAPSTPQPSGYDCGVYAAAYTPPSSRCSKVLFLLLSVHSPALDEREEFVIGERVWRGRIYNRLCTGINFSGGGESVPVQNLQGEIGTDPPGETF